MSVFRHLFLLLPVGTKKCEFSLRAGAAAILASKDEVDGTSPNGSDGLADKRESARFNVEVANGSRLIAVTGRYATVVSLLCVADSSPGPKNMSIQFLGWNNETEHAPRAHTKRRVTNALAPP